ncbi:MAG TPA: hypothetical protein VFG37_12455, partial [Planctomycetota bacterium]|nr:hypothetical protein [Planctomycetota bacterium]
MSSAASFRVLALAALSVAAACQGGASDASTQVQPAGPAGAAAPARHSPEKKGAADDVDIPFTKFTLGNGLTVIVHE